ncbi:Serine/threonine-protein kinase brsk1, partial [Dinochytrium kinnereticum]
MSDDSNLNMIGPFKLLDPLGFGSFGEVREAINTETNERVAIKIIRKEDTSDGVRDQLEEVVIMESLNHPNVIKFLKCFEDADQIVIVMEFAAGGDLEDYVQKQGGHLTEEEARIFFSQILR